MLAAQVVLSEHTIGEICAFKPHTNIKKYRSFFGLCNVSSVLWIVSCLYWLYSPENCEKEPGAFRGTLRKRIPRPTENTEKLFTLQCCSREDQKILTHWKSTHVIDNLALCSLNNSWPDQMNKLDIGGGHLKRQGALMILHTNHFSLWPGPYKE